MKVVRTINDSKRPNLNETIIESHLVASGSKVKCRITGSYGDNADAEFRLSIEQAGQVFKGCDLEMCGPIERGEMIEFLKQLIVEMELIDKKEN